MDTDLQGKIPTKQVLFGLTGLLAGGALFIFSAFYMNAEGVYYSLAGFALLCVLYAIGYAVSGNLITSSIVPLVMFASFELAGLVPKLPDGSVLKSTLHFVFAQPSGQIIFLLSILAAYAVHQRLNKR